MKLLKLSLLLNRSIINSKHKKYAFFATIVLCLEYLDLIVYIKNTRILIDIYLVQSVSRMYGIIILFGILWLTNFITKLIVPKVLWYLQRNYSNSQLVIYSSLIIAVTFVAQALILLLYCHTLILSLLLSFLLIRFIYQLALAIIVHDTYEFLLNTQELSNEVIYLLLNSLELSVLLGIIGYKILFMFDFNLVQTMVLFLSFISLLWLLGAVVFILNRRELNQLNDSNIRCMAANNFSIMLKRDIKDTIIAFSIVGVRSSLCIIGVIYMPIYLIGSLHFLPKSANSIIMLSSLLAFSLCVYVDRHLHKYSYTNILKSGLVGLIIGCIISYLLFFFKIVPFIGVAILIIFHSLFALFCPLVLNNLFTQEIRQVAILSCYRNSFLIFASFTYILLSLFTEILHNYIVTPTIFLIAITCMCYICLVLFNKQVKYVN